MRKKPPSISDRASKTQAIPCGHWYNSGMSDCHDKDFISQYQVNKDGLKILMDLKERSHTWPSGQVTMISPATKKLTDTSDCLLLNHEKYVFEDNSLCGMNSLCFYIVKKK